jgi:2-hydroxychromene-2-carboxylate isomerase
VPPRAAYLFTDFDRFARRYGVPLVMNPHFPINTITLMRMDVGLQLRRRCPLQAYRDAVFRAIWAESEEHERPGHRGQVLQAAGFDAPALLAMAQDPQVKDRLKAVTQQAWTAASSAPRPFSSATRCSGARTGSISSARP